jgi:hypothetical protein
VRRHLEFFHEVRQGESHLDGVLDRLQGLILERRGALVPEKNVRGRRIVRWPGRSSGGRLLDRQGSNPVRSARLVRLSSFGINESECRKRKATERRADRLPQRLNPLPRSSVVRLDPILATSINRPWAPPVAEMPIR